MGIAVGLPKGDALDLGEIPEPTDAHRSNRLVACVDDHVGCLIVVAVKSLLRLDAVLLHEADGADGVGMQQLLVSRHDLRADLIVTRGDGPHAILHSLDSILPNVVGIRAIRPKLGRGQNVPPFYANVELTGHRYSGCRCVSGQPNGDLCRKSAQKYARSGNCRDHGIAVLSTKQQNALGRDTSRLYFVNHLPKVVRS